MKLERKAMGLHLEECQVAKFNLMNSAIRPKADFTSALGSFFLSRKGKEEN